METEMCDFKRTATIALNEAGEAMAEAEADWSKKADATAKMAAAMADTVGK